MKIILIAAGALVAGIVLGVLLREPAIRSLKRKVRKLRYASGNSAVDRLSTHEKALYYKMLDDLENGRASRRTQKRSVKKNILRSVTRFLFVTTQVFALGWVSWTYIISTYSTVVLAQPFPVEELSRQAIITLLGMSGLKVVENIFEHNEGPVFGKSPGSEETPQEEPPDETEAEG